MLISVAKSPESMQENKRIASIGQKPRVINRAGLDRENDEPCRLSEREKKQRRARTIITMEGQGETGNVNLRKA
uniref:Uncharacterized protein n=1 Tax=Arundo donax TaxID=35708 RepID=A0A0A9BUX5_ARUDO